MDVAETLIAQHTSGRFIKKVCMVGDPGVGKTSLVTRYTTGTFDDRYLMTIGARVATRDLLASWNNDGQVSVHMTSFSRKPPQEIRARLQSLKPSGEGKLVHVKLMVWDIAGQKTFRWVKPLYYMNASVAPIIYDTTSVASALDIPYWVDALRSIAPRVRVVIVGNKTDLPPVAEALATAREMALEYSAPHMFTSAKEENGVADLFSWCALTSLEETGQKR